jgi:Flp pilus assembly protein TadG
MFFSRSFNRDGSNREDSRKISRARRHGAATLELALTLGILFSICYGTIEYGYYFYAKNVMDGAAREGCRNAIVAGATISGANTVIENQLQVGGLVSSSTTASGSGSSYTIGNYTVTYYDSTAGASVSSLSNMTVGDTLTVTITATWGVVGAAFRPEALIGYSKQLVTASSMRKEGD